MKRFCTAVLFVLTSCCLVSFSAPSAKASPTTDQKQFLQQFNQTSTSDPAAAAASSKDFLAKNPTMEISLRARVQTSLASLYYSKLHDATSGLAVLDSGLAEVDQAKPAWGNDVARVMLLTDKAWIFASDHKGQETLDILQKNWPLFLNANGPLLHVALPLYGTALNLLNKQNELAPVLEKVLVAHPEFGDDSWVMTNLVKNLVGQGKNDEALGYAKLYWMLCSFDAGNINDATNLLTGSWTAIDLNSAKADAFLKAQQDKTAENPLQAIKLPAFDAASLDEALAKMPATATDQRITILLMEGKMRDAMLEARRGLLDHPSADTSPSILEMARVFKAADLNLVRANAFLQYYKTGTGANPLEEFLKQFPAQAAAK